MRRYVILAVACVLSAATARCLLAGPAGPRVHGHVFETSPKGRVVGTVPHATIEYLDESGATAASAQSNAQGYYRTDLMPGRYYFRVKARGFRTEDRGRGILVERSDGYLVQDFSLRRGESPADAPPSKLPTQPLGVFVGRVQGETPSGKEVPVPGARITLRRQGEVKTMVIVARAHPGKDQPAGEFQVRLPAGRWHAAVEARGFERLVDPALIDLSAEGSTDRTFTLKRLAPKLPVDQGIRGDIVVDDRGGTVKKPQHVQLFLRALRARAPYPRRVTLQQSGHSFVQNLPQGLYLLGAKAEGYRPAFTYPLLVLEGRYTNVQFVLKPQAQETVTAQVEPRPRPATLKVSVLGEDAQGQRHPLEGAAVALCFADESDRPQTTNTRGEARWQLDGLANARKVVVRARKDGFDEASRPYSVAPGDEKQLTIVLRSTTQPKKNELPDGMSRKVRAKNTVTGYVVYLDAQGTRIGVPGTRVTWHREMLDDKSGERVGEAFRRQDKDGDGRVPVSELALRSPKAADCDRDGDGSITEKEFAVFLARLLEEHAWSVVSGKRGHFSLELPPGPYRVTTHPPAGYQGTDASMEIRQNAPSQDVHVTRQAPATWRLMVRVSELVVPPRSSTGPAQSKPSAGALVRLVPQSPQGPVREERTAADGTASFQVPGGEYWVQASKDGDASNSKTFTVGGGPSDVDLVIRRASVEDPHKRGIWFTVHEAGNRSRLLPEAKVVVNGSGKRFSVPCDTVLKTYHADVPPGEYTVHVAHAGYQARKLTVHVRQGVPTAEYVGLSPLVQLPPARSLVEIRVMIDHGGEFGTGPLAGANVVITHGGKTVASGLSSLDGLFRTALPRNAGYQLRVTADPNRRLVPFVQTFSMGASYSTEVVLRQRPMQGGHSGLPQSVASWRDVKTHTDVRSFTNLPPLGLVAIRLTVVDSTSNSPLSGVSVQLRLGSLPAMPLRETSSGTFTASVLPGIYEARFSKPGYRPQTLRVDVVPNGPVTKTVPLVFDLQ